MGRAERVDPLVPPPSPITPVRVGLLSGWREGGGSRGFREEGHRWIRPRADHFNLAGRQSEFLSSPDQYVYTHVSHVSEI